jgi:hypothetical protein
MPKTITILLMILLLAPLQAKAEQDIRLDPDYDPRIELRVVVLPAIKDRSLRRESERTISALLATELLRIYEVLDLDRFEQFLSDRDLTLNEALAGEAEAIVRDSAQVDALADVEIYRWDSGQTGIPLLGRSSGRIGVRARIMDPYTGRVYWSVNRLEKVKPGMEFLDRATVLFRDMVDDLDEELSAVVTELDEWEAYEAQLADGEQPRLRSKGERKFTDAIRADRGFVPHKPHRFGQDALAEVSPRPSVKEERVAQPAESELTEETAAPAKSDPRTLLPPLFDTSYEDIEGEDESPDLDSQRELYLTPPVLRKSDPKSSGRTAAPPIPERYRPSGETLPPLQLRPAGSELESQPDSTMSNPAG